jgi:hypothetical protein
MPQVTFIAMSISLLKTGKSGSSSINGVIAAVNAAIAAINAAIALLAPLASPVFTGNPTAPTQASGNSSTRLATTAFVEDSLNGGQALRLKEYTVAELPAAAAGNARQLVYVSNGSAGNPCVAFSTGADWKVVGALGAVVAAA